MENGKIDFGTTFASRYTSFSSHIPRNDMFKEQPHANHSDEYQKFMWNRKESLITLNPQLEQVGSKTFPPPVIMTVSEYQSDHKGLGCENNSTTIDNLHSAPAEDDTSSEEEFIK